MANKLFGNIAKTGFLRLHKDLPGWMTASDGDCFLIDPKTDKCIAYLAICGNFSDISKYEGVVRGDRAGDLPAFALGFSIPPNWWTYEHGKTLMEIEFPRAIYIYDFDDYAKTAKGRRPDNFKKITNIEDLTSWERSVRR